MMKKNENQEDALFKIQRLQFVDQRAANEHFIELFQGVLPFKIKSAAVTPRAVSLNSISGSLIAENGDTYFFKTHVEPNSILQEYYNVKILEDAGYPVIKPLFVEDSPGQQIVVYPFIRSRTVFDLAIDADAGALDYAPLLKAQVNSDRQLDEIYRRTLARDDRQSESPVHQLFYHRLAGRRFADFYGNASFTIGQQRLSFTEVAQYKWIINGIAYTSPLSRILEEALALLRPDQTWGHTIVGHGDAHNGNLFLDEQKDELLYFDPAFAGKHSPFLDLVKPFFHNVFATWMYHPDSVAASLRSEVEISGKIIRWDHNYEPSALRREILRSKAENVLSPLLADVSRLGIGRAEVLARMRSALMCCPLLTVNLADNRKYPPEIALLGLSQCVELASSAVHGVGCFDNLFGADACSGSWMQS